MDLEVYIKNNYGAKNEMYIQKVTKPTTPAKVIRINDHRAVSQEENYRRYPPYSEYGNINGNTGFEDDNSFPPSWMNFNETPKIIYKIPYGEYWDYLDLTINTYYKTKLYGFIKILKVNELNCTYIIDANPFPVLIDDYDEIKDARTSSVDRVCYMLHDYTMSDIDEWGVGL